MIFLVLQEGDR